MNFGGNTGMYGGMNRYSNIGTVYTASGIDAGSTAVFKGYGNLSEGFETNPTVYDLYMSSFMREKSAATIAEADRPAWFRAYQERRWGYTDDALVAAYGTLATTVWQSHTYNVRNQQGVIENILCASPSYGATKTSQWGPAYTTLPYEPTDLMPVAQTFLETMEAHPELLELETFRYDMVEFFAQLLADRARVILKDCVNSGSKRAEFLNLIELSEKVLACSNGFRLDAKENRTKSVAGDDGVAAYRRMVTTWMGSYQRGQDTQLHEYAHRAYAGLMKDYYKKRWEAFFKSQTGVITSAAYVNTLKALDETFPTAELTPTANGNLKEIAAEIVDFLTPQSLTWNGAADNTLEGANWTNAKGETVAWEDGKSVVLTGVDKTIVAQNSVTIGNVELTTDMTTAANVYGGTNGGYVTTDTDLGWTGLTLDDLASAKYTGIMSGAWMGGAKLDCSAYHVKKDGDSVTMQFQVVHDSQGVFTKVVAVKLSINDAGHVIANYLWANNGAADAIGREFKQTDTPANGAPDGYQGADPKYGMIGISRFPASSVTVTGPVSIIGEVTLNLGEAVSFPGATMIDTMVLENGNATLVLGANQNLTINVVNALNGSKLVLKGTAATLQGASGAAKVKLPATALANVVYVGPDGDEQALKLDAEGYAKTKVGTMSYSAQISEKTNLGWKNVTLDDLYNCAFTTEGQMSADIQKGDTAVTFKLGFRSVTLTIENGFVYAAAFPAIQGLTATPAVARVIAPVTESEGSGLDTLSYAGEIANSWVELGWPTTLTAEDLKGNYTFTSGGVTASNVSIQFDAVYMYFGSSYVMLMNPKGVWKAIVNTGASISGLTATPSQGGVSGGVTNFASLTDAITAANGAAKVTLLDDVTVTTAINNSYKTWIEIPYGLTLTATCGDFIWWDKAYTLDIYGTLDLGGNALSVGKSKNHTINLYTGGEIKSTNAKGLVIFDANTTINVKANDGFDTATLNTPVQARQNTTIAVEAGVTAVLNGGIVLMSAGESGVANPVVTKTGTGTLEFNGAVADGATLVHNEGTLAFAMAPSEVRVVTVANAQAVVNASSTDEDYEIIDSAEGNVHTYTSTAIPWVAAVGAERVDTGWIKYRTYKEALAVVKDGQCVYVLDETCIPEGTEITSGPAGSYLTIKDGYKVDAQGNVVPDVKLYYASNLTDWTQAVKVANSKDGECTIATKAGDIVTFDKGGEFGPIYIHGKSGEKVPVAGFEVLSGTLKIGYEGSNASIPEGWIVTVADGAAVQFDNWANGWPVKVMDATFNGTGTVTFGSTITSASVVTFGTVKGDATIAIPSGVTVTVTGSIENPITGAGTIKISGEQSLTFAADSAVTVQHEDLAQGYYAATAVVENADGTTTKTYSKVENIDATAFGIDWYDSDTGSVYVGPETAGGDAKWDVGANWLSVDKDGVVGARRTGAPYKGNPYNYSLFNGDYISNVTPDANGVKHITADSLDFWRVRLGITNKVDITVNEVTKIQTGASAFIYVDPTSKLTIKKVTNNKGETIDLHSAAPEGIVFEGINGNVWNFYLEGEGTVQFNCKLSGSHTVKAAEVGLGTGECKHILSKKIIGFTSIDSAATVTLAADAKISAVDGTTMTAGEVSATAEVGTYALRTGTDGVYLDYVARRGPKVAYYKSGYIGNETSLALTETSGGTAATYEDIAAWNIVIDSNSPANAWAAKSYKYDGHDITVTKFIIEKNFTIKNGANQEGIFGGITFEVASGAKLTLADSAANQKMTLGAAHFTGAGEVDISGVSTWTTVTAAEGMAVKYANTLKVKKTTADGVTTYTVSTDPTSWEDVDETTPLEKVIPTAQVKALSKYNVTAAQVKTWADTYGVTFDPVNGINLECFALNTSEEYLELTKGSFKMTFSFDENGKPVADIPSYLYDWYNIKPVIKGSADLKTWHDKADGDKFFKAVIDL
ncbi:MAG: alpha-N-acetylglucosaminidase [Kiritimatiellae bacterium]|nr:alpha-N-acetylglucosaminidase [Kiritimatiellia bacterium]